MRRRLLLSSCGVYMYIGLDGTRISESTRNLALNTVSGTNIVWSRIDTYLRPFQYTTVVVGNEHTNRSARSFLASSGIEDNNGRGCCTIISAFRWGDDWWSWYTRNNHHKFSIDGYQCPHLRPPVVWSGLRWRDPWWRSRLPFLPLEVHGWQLEYAICASKWSR